MGMDVWAESVKGEVELDEDGDIVGKGVEFFDWRKHDGLVSFLGQKTGYEYLGGCHAYEVLPEYLDDLENLIKGENELYLSQKNYWMHPTNTPDKDREFIKMARARMADGEKVLIKIIR